MDEKDDLTVKVGEKSRSLIITIPKSIADELKISKGDYMVYKILGDLINLRKMDSHTPIDIVTREVLNFTAKVRRLKEKEIQLAEDRISDKPDVDKKKNTADDIERTWKLLNKEFEYLKQEIDKKLTSVGETFSTSIIKEIDDIFLLEKSLVDIESDYDITLNFVDAIVQRKKKFSNLIKKVDGHLEAHKINEKEANEVRQKFQNELEICDQIINRISKLVEKASTET